jgi:protein-tyrosine-phosphatase
LLEKRNVRIHRKDIDVRGDFSRQIREEHISVSDSVSIVVCDRYGNIKQQPTSQQQNLEKEYNQNLPEEGQEKQFESNPSPEQNAQVKWYLVDYQNKELREVCDDFLKMMKAFVNKIQSKFP